MVEGKAVLKSSALSALAPPAVLVKVKTGPRAEGALVDISSNERGVVVPTPIREKLCSGMKRLLAAVVAKALAANPLSRLAFRFGTTVVDETANGAVPVATVEINCPAEERLPVVPRVPVTLWFPMN